MAHVLNGAICTPIFTHRKPGRTTINNAPTPTSPWYFSAIRLRGSHGNLVGYNQGSGNGQPPIQEAEGSSGNTIFNNFSVIPPTTTTVVSSSQDSSVYGQNITFTATVATGKGGPVTSGAVTFEEGNTILASAVPLDGNGQATFQSSTLSAAASPHTISAYYSGSSYFEVSSGSVIQTVNKAPLIVIAPDISRTYGSSNPNLASYVYGVQNNEPITATYSTPATPASPVGTYPVMSTLSDGGTGKLANYTPTFINGTLTIAPAPLIITPTNVTRPFDTSNPTLTGTISGIQNNDNITAGYSTRATLTSPVGTYPITASLRDPDRKSVNYDVKINQGTLTIIPNSDTLLVTTTADSGPGSLRNVLANAPAGSTLHLGIGGTIFLTSGPLVLSKDVTIAVPVGSFLAISGDNRSRVFQIAPGVSVTLSRLTIENGDSAGGAGGGIENEGTLTLVNCRILGNFASPRGGGIYNAPTGTLTLLQTWSLATRARMPAEGFTTRAR
jgi:hypothetical protein